MASFSDALNRSSETIKRPPPPPIGHYVMTISKAVPPAEPINTAKFQGSKLTLPVSIVSAAEDVDEDELADFGNVAGFNLRLDFMFNEAPGEETKFESTLNRLKEFCLKCGVEDTPGKALSEMLMELPGTHFIGELKHRANPNDIEEVYPEIGATTKYE